MSKPFDNEIAYNYIVSLVEQYIHPVIIENIELKHVKPYIKTYYYERVRAAAELMIMIEYGQAYGFSKFYYQIAIQKLGSISVDSGWFSDMGFYEPKTKGVLSEKGKAYNEDIKRQIKILKELENRAEE